MTTKLFNELRPGDLFKWHHLTGIKIGPKSANVSYQGRESSMMIPAHEIVQPVNE
jgi:hypothetical protein